MSQSAAPIGVDIEWESFSLEVHNQEVSRRDRNTGVYLKQIPKVCSHRSWVME